MDSLSPSPLEPQNIPPPLNIQCAFVTGGSGFVGRNLIRLLKARDIQVKALARSEQSMSIVRSLGAEAIQGDLDAIEAMQEGMKGCDVVFHAAAFVDDWGAYDAIYHINVTGTQNALKAAQGARVPRFIHISTEAVYLGGAKLHQADESLPLPQKTLGMYPRTKALAEKHVLSSNSPELQTVVIRPRLIWGNDDSSLLPKITEVVRNGDFMWIDHGQYLTSTCHIDNLCHALVLAAEKGLGGEAYFITDGEPILFRHFFTQWLGTQHITLDKKSIPYWLARLLALVVDSAWTLLKIKKRPPLTTATVLIMGEEVTLDSTKAQEHLGYAPVITREVGLEQMKAPEPAQSP